MENKIPDYFVVYDELQETQGLFKLTLVEKPAYEENYVLFDKQTPVRFSTDKTRGIIMGPIMIPDQKIYRNNKDLGEFNLIITPPMIEKIVMNFMKEKRTQEVNAHVHKSPVVDGVYIYNMWIADKQMGIHPPDLFKDLPYGTAFACAKVDNPQILADIEAGKINGFSIESFFGISRTNPTGEMELSLQIAKILEIKVN